MATHLKYLVTVPNVQEASLYGSADLDFWREQLKPEGLAPRDDAGRVELLLIAARMQWLGVWFSELSISIALSPAAPARALLLYAFNSLPWFAWAERTFFQTPYYSGQTRLETRVPARIELSLTGAAGLSATMTEARAPAWSGDETWEGGILLPRRLSRAARAEKLFHARLSGTTAVYPFASTDALSLTPAPGAPILQQLKDSHFTGKEWHLRAAATHAKSETVQAR